jgi:hypothetical protein
MSDTPRCDRCVSWDRDNKDFTRVPGTENIRKCRRAVLFWNVTEWNDQNERELMPGHKDDQMFLQDGSDYYAVFLTRDGFFCASFQAVKP